jgi:hypothetical protein
MSDKTVLNSIKVKSQVGANAMTASRESFDDLYVDGIERTTVDQLLAQLAANGPTTLEARQQFAAAVVEPIQQIIPYVELYGRFFQNVGIDYLENTLIPVEDIVNIAYSSHPRTEIAYNEQGYYFATTTYQTWTTGVRIPWNLAAKAGWNVLARQMNYVRWEMARKRDAAAKVVVDAAVPTAHKLSSTGTISKAGVDEVLRKSAQIGFPVTQALINPGLLMEMQGWTWTMPNIPVDVAQQLIDNGYYGNYGGIKWFVNPNASTSVVYFAGDPAQIGWHFTRGTGRNDSAIDVDRGEDRYALRDAEHAWYVGSGLSLWQITQI